MSQDQLGSLIQQWSPHEVNPGTELSTSELGGLFLSNLINYCCQHLSDTEDSSVSVATNSATSSAIETSTKPAATVKDPSGHIGTVPPGQSSISKSKFVRESRKVADNHWLDQKPNYRKSASDSWLQTHIRFCQPSACVRNRKATWSIDIYKWIANTLSGRFISRTMTRSWTQASMIIDCML